MEIALYVLAGISICVFAHFWLWSDPDNPFFHFWIQRWKIWRIKKRREKETSQLPQRRISELGNGLRIVISEFTKQGDPVCKKILVDREYDEFVLIEYGITEPFKMINKIYQVQHHEQENCFHLEYLRERFNGPYTRRDPDESTYYNQDNVPIILDLSKKNTQT